MVSATEDNHVDPVLLLEENLASYQLLLRLAEETQAEIVRGNSEGFAEHVARLQQIQAEISARVQIMEQARSESANSLTDRKVTKLIELCAATIAAVQEVDRKTRSLV